MNTPKSATKTFLYIITLVKYQKASNLNKGLPIRPSLSSHSQSMEVNNLPINKQAHLRSFCHPTWHVPTLSVFKQRYHLFFFFKSK